MTPIVVSQDRLEELAFENPGTSIEIHTHTSSLRVGDVLYIASLPENRGLALADQHVAEAKVAAGIALATTDSEYGGER